MKTPRPSLVDCRGSSFLAAVALACAGTAARAAEPAAASSETSPALAALLHDAREKKLADSREWQVMLHYRPTALGGWKSQADGLGFFFAGKAGKTDREAELAATITALLRPAVRDPTNPQTMHPQCLFPARYAWLKQQLGSAAFIDQPCPLLDTWRTGISAEAATLIYATAYLNSPASMYGHTFLRLQRATGEGNPLLDYAVNFAADADTTNGMVYAIAGLTGGFQGHFYVVPYYVKVQEYSNMESRDLWEYELTLTREQIERLVLHAWETRSTYFDYFFIDENCSYQLLTLLEAADPALHLIDNFAGRVVPADTIRVALEQPGLVRRVVSRPSLVSTMTDRRARLDRREVGAAEQWAKSPPDTAGPVLTGEPASRQAQVIDTAYDYLRYREGFKSAEPSDAFKKRERRMLLARGRLGVPPQEVAVRSSVDPPQDGHGTLRLSVGGGLSNVGGSFETLAIRGAIHDFLDPSGGYPENAVLEMGSVRGRFDNQTQRPRLDRLDLLNILSATPLDRWVHSMSWKVWVGADNARELGCEQPASDRAGWRCLYGGANVGGGLALRLGPANRWLAFGFTETDAGAGPAFAAGHDFRVGAGAEAGLVGEANPLWHFQIGARYIYYFLGDTRPGFRTRVAQSLAIGHGLALRLAVDTANTYAEASTELVGYF